MYSSINVIAAALAATAAAKTVVITVGQGGFVFTPDTSTADIGDTLEFHFTSSLHSAVQGDFSTPCSMGSLASTGFDSGSVTSSEVFQVAVTTTDPIWFFCGTPTHCQGGMAGVVNPPSSGNSLAGYKSAAAETSSTSSAGKAQGGVVVAAGSGSSSSSSASAVSSSSASSTAAKSTASTSGAGSSSSVAAAATPSTSSSSRSNSTVTPAKSPSSSASSTASATPTPGAGNSLMDKSGKTAAAAFIGMLGAFVLFMA